ncbi:hypothetical protein R1flu_015215 [Riccia fluitans]|uniref:Uncharacterized protein n=1 Tax=Riccia fluitans TaxID=41844 RepID=A0ABD1YIB2_9MARC
MPGLYNYLKQAKQKKLLPEWWSSEHDTKVIKTAMTHKWANINCAVEAKDIRGHYDPLNSPFETTYLPMMAYQVPGRGEDF